MSSEYRTIIGVNDEWFSKFPNKNKVSFINKKLIGLTKTGLRAGVQREWSEESYKKAFTYFYKDKQFNHVYDCWEGSGKRKGLVPSLDHIIPVAKGGTSALSNLQFIPLWENRAKWAMSQEEWDYIKSRIDLRTDEMTWCTRCDKYLNISDMWSVDVSFSQRSSSRVCFCSLECYHAKAGSLQYCINEETGERETLADAAERNLQYWIKTRPPGPYL